MTVRDSEPKFSHQYSSRLKQKKMLYDFVTKDSVAYVGIQPAYWIEINKDHRISGRVTSINMYV